MGASGLLKLSPRLSHKRLKEGAKVVVVSVCWRTKSGIPNPPPLALDPLESQRFRRFLFGFSSEEYEKGPAPQSGLFRILRMEMTRSFRFECCSILSVWLASFGFEFASPRFGAALFSACACYSQKNSRTPTTRMAILWM